ncbi:MAG: helix-turn-helix domain-containing protein [Streptosporangiales bacterium]|nr:helix-turn-helix domain-containing protein [Streptosporangiales bacterium]
MRRTTSDKGILRPQEAAEHIDLRRYPPEPDVGRFVERYWAVHWDLRDRDPYRVDIISHPCVNVTFTTEMGGEVHGVGTRTSSHPLAGSGRVFGVKFRPGGFFAYGGLPVASLTDRSVPLREVFGPAADALTDAVLDADTDTDERRIGLVQAFLRQRLPVTDDPAYHLLVGIVTTMLDDRAVTRVDQVAARYDMSARTLQRLFHRYVGVGPKWMIRRYRLHDGAELLATGAVADPAALAVELGWFDQAHFTRDFSALIGVSPVEYAMACATTGDREPMALVGATPAGG